MEKTGKVLLHINDACFLLLFRFFFHGHLADHGKIPGKISLHIKDVSATKQMFKGGHGKGVQPGKGMQFNILVVKNIERY